MILRIFHAVFRAILSTSVLTLLFLVACLFSGLTLKVFTPLLIVSAAVVFVLMLIFQIDYIILGEKPELVGMQCQRCGGSGFLHFDQIPDHYRNLPLGALLSWSRSSRNLTEVRICDCCSDGHLWYGIPGRHYSDYDPPGVDGCYSGSYGFSKCHFDKPTS